MSIVGPSHKLVTKLPEKTSSGDKTNIVVVLSEIEAYVFFSLL